MFSIYYIKKIVLTYLLTKYGIDIDVAIVNFYNSKNNLHFADIQCIGTHISLYRMGICGYGSYILGYPRKICGYGYGYGYG